MLDIYDDAMLRFASQIRWQGKSVPCVVAGADRAYSKIKEWMETERGLEQSNVKGEVALPYPFMAVWRETFTPADELATGGLYRIPFRDAGYGMAMKSPRSVKAKCDMNIYCRDTTQLRFLEVQIRNLFDHKWSYIPVDFGDTRWYQPPNDVYSFAKILGKLDLLLYEEGFSDQSSLEDSGLSQRDIRATLTYTMYGWIPYQPYAVPVAEKFTIRIKEETFDETIAEITTKPDNGD